MGFIHPRRFLPIMGSYRAGESGAFGISKAKVKQNGKPIVKRQNIMHIRHNNGFNNTFYKVPRKMSTVNVSEQYAFALKMPRRSDGQQSS